MAWRFKASKYKNAVPVVPKPETYVRDICVGSYQTYGNNITASAKFMAFNWDHSGSSLAVLPITDSGRKSKLMPLVHAHSDTVTDMDFSPFHDGLLATGSQDCLIKIWNIPEEGLQESLTNPECTFSFNGQKRVETIGFHPSAEFLLHSSCFSTIVLWDLIAEKHFFHNSDQHTEVIQSVSWKSDGTLLATSCKDKQVRILDPRVESACCIKAANSHQSIKDSRVVWLGDGGRVLTTGFDSQRLRQIIIRDLRKFEEPEKTLELDCSTGILIPLYDMDTDMLFLAGKGDTTIGYMEVTEKEPFLIEGIRHSGEQTKGACLVPKRALNVMQGEVNRILQLTSSSVIPITYQVPRKTYRDFHADLYPNTNGFQTELIASEWQQGKNIPLLKISLDPAKREKNEEPIIVHKGPLSNLQEQYNNLLKNKEVLSPLPNSTDIINQSEYHPVKSLIKDLEKDNPCLKKDFNDQNEEEKIPDKRIGEYMNSKKMKDEANEVEVKPRLGPKPFCSLNRNEIFAVSPPSLSNGMKTIEPEENIEVTSEITFTSDIDTLTKEPETGKSDTSGEEETSCDSGYIPKTPSTAERRKLFEIPSNLKETDATSDDNVDHCDNLFERASIQRSSIAERRKVYERSQSVQEGTKTERSDGSVILSRKIELMPETEAEPLSVSNQVDDSPVLMRRKDSFKNRKNTEDDFRKNPFISKQQSLDPRPAKKTEAAAVPTPKRTSTVFGRVSKFRHLKVTPAHKSFHIENVRNLSRQISGECDGFHANPERVALPLSGPGGKIAIFDLQKTGKLPDGVIPALVHGNNIMDFAWDPFDHSRLAVACDDGMIKLWRIPEAGLSEPTNETEGQFSAHLDKIYFLKFHPTAKDVLATGSNDMTIKIWDLNTLTENIVLKGHTDQMFSFSWSPCGSFCATVCKDGKLRIYKPRASVEPIREGKGPEGNRGARVIWALDGSFLVVMGFDKVSERQITVYRSIDLNTPLNTIGLDVSPAILIPFYDEDSSTLFLTGKGDSTIYAFEITEEAPYICPLSHHRCNSLHQGLSFLGKNVCDVSNVEFAKALRLTNNTIEPLSFTVPRIKTDLFQDDLFPPTKVTWIPALTSMEWFNGQEKIPSRISLQPDGMDLLSESQNNLSNNTRTINKSASTPFIGASQPFNRLGWNADMSGQTKTKQDEVD